jgi:hypothetical protein
VGKRSEESQRRVVKAGDVKMRAGFTSLALILFGGALAGCGGGSGGGTPPTAAPSPSFTGSRPAGNGDAFGFAGGMTQLYVRPPVTDTPLPSPNPTSSSSTVSTVAQQVTVASGATFQGRTGLFDFTIAETDTAPLKTTTLVTDEYLAYGTAGLTTAVSIVGSKTTSSDGAVFVTVFGPGNGLLDVLPEAPGRIGSAPNNATLTVTETDPDGQVTTRSTNPDGTYQEQAQFPDGTSSLATELADGTGTYSVPYVIPGTPYGDGVAPPNTVLTIHPPANLPTTVPFIPVSIAYSYGTAPSPAPSATPAATPTPVQRSVRPVWYPGGVYPTVPSSETYVNAGAAALPPACNVPAALLGGRPTNQLVQSIARTDIVFGETEAETTTTYTAEGLGVVCLQLSDIVTHYYDFSGQNLRALATSGTPLQIDTLTETLALQSASVKASNASRGAQSLGLAAAVPPVRTSIRLAAERERLRRHAAAFRSFHRSAVKGAIRW